MILWKPGLIDESLESTLKTSKSASIVCKFPIKESEVWYVRFGLDFNQRVSNRIFKCKENFKRLNVYGRSWL